MFTEKILMTILIVAGVLGGISIISPRLGGISNPNDNAVIAKYDSMVIRMNKVEQQRDSLRLLTDILFFKLEKYYQSKTLDHADSLLSEAANNVVRQRTDQELDSIEQDYLRYLENQRRNGNN